MKTKINFFVTLFLIAHVAVLGQTIANQAFQHNADYVLGYSYFTEEEKRLYSSVEDPSELIIQSDELLKRARKIKMDANLFRGEEKERYLKKADELTVRSNKLKLAACELLAYNNRMEFSILKAAFISQLKTIDVENGVIKQSKQNYQLAVQTFRIAKELREEAYAQRSMDAILANLHNAEEKEMVAFKKLVDASNLLSSGATVSMAKK